MEYEIPYNRMDAGDNAKAWSGEMYGRYLGGTCRSMKRWVYHIKTAVSRDVPGDQRDLIRDRVWWRQFLLTGEFLWNFPANKRGRNPAHVWQQDLFIMWPSSALRRQGKADKMEKPGDWKIPLKCVAERNEWKNGNCEDMEQLRTAIKTYCRGERRKKGDKNVNNCRSRKPGKGIWKYKT